MIVVAFHLFETYSKGPSDQILNHGYLAVDFFFVLSGFVIGYAYDDRWSKMNVWGFFKRRLIRLQPMVILGTLIGAFWFYFGGAPGFELVMQTPWWKLLLIVILGCLMFPTPPSMDIRGWQECRIKLNRGGMTWCSVAVAATLVVPHLGGADHEWINGLYCAVVILLIYPAVVAARAGSPLRGRRTTAICKFLGMISYPLYITHYPMIYVQMNWAARHADAPVSTHIWVAVSIFIASIAVAYASVKIYDIPVRAWLSEQFLYKSGK